MIPNSYLLAPSPLTGPVVWGRLPHLLREQGYDVVVINVEDDDQPPYADRYVTRATVQISAADLAPPMIFVAHSGAGPLLPAITTSLALAGGYRSAVGYIFLDAGLPRPGPGWTSCARKTTALLLSSSTRCAPVPAFRSGR